LTPLAVVPYPEPGHSNPEPADAKRTWRLTVAFLHKGSLKNGVTSWQIAGLVTSIDRRVTSNLD